METANGEIYIFTIGEGKGHKLVQKLVPTWSGKGFGLALNRSRTEGPLDFKGLSSSNELRASTCKCRVNLTDDSDCTAGGNGSTSCSIGSTVNDPGCSVSCNEHYYACCRSE